METARDLRVPAARLPGIGRVGSEVVEQLVEANAHRAVEQRMVGLDEQRDPAACEPLEQPYLPERPVVVQMAREQLADEGPELLATAGRGHADREHVIADVDVIEIGPERAIEPERHRDQPSAQRLHQAEAGGEQLADPFDVGRSAVRRGLELDQCARVHVPVRRFPVDEARVHDTELADPFGPGSGGARGGRLPHRPTMRPAPSHQTESKVPAGGAELLRRARPPDRERPRRRAVPSSGDVGPWRPGPVASKVASEDSAPAAGNERTRA